MKLTKTQNDSPVIVLKHPNYFARLTLGSNHDRITVKSKTKQIELIHFYGFKGYIIGPLIDEILNRPQVIRPKLFSNFLKSIKFPLLNKLIRLSRRFPSMLQTHRNIFIRIVNDDGFGSEYGRSELGKEVNVNLLHVGWRSIAELANKKVYVEVLKTELPSPKAERAACMGYYVVCAETHTEKKLLERMIGAKDLDQLHDSILKDLSTTIHATGKLKTLLDNAGEVLDLLTGTDGVPKSEKNGDMVSNSESNTEAKITTNGLANSLDKYNNSTIRPIENGDRQTIVSIDSSHKNEKKYLRINNIKLALCNMDREDINALANPAKREIFINIHSPVIQKFINQTSEVQKVLLLEEITHELAHLMGYGLADHDIEFFKKQRALKYKAILGL